MQLTTVACLGLPLAFFGLPLGCLHALMADKMLPPPEAPIYMYIYIDIYNADGAGVAAGAGHLRLEGAEVPTPYFSEC